MSETRVPSTSPQRAPVALVAVIVVVATITLGLNEAGIGAAWPEIRSDIGKSLDAQGLVLIASTAGFLVAALPHGWIIRRFGTGDVLVVVAGVGIAGSVVFAASSVWGLLLTGAFVLGAAAGGMDSTLNSYAALHHSPRVISFMHAGFGIGATLSPLVLNLLLGGGHSWRWLWIGLALFDVLLLGVFVFMRLRWHDARLESRGAPRPRVPRESASTQSVELANPGPDPVAEREIATPVALPSDTSLEMATMVGDAAFVELGHQSVEPPQARARVLFGLNVACFFLYTGTEQAAGAWATTLMLHRGFGSDAARVITTIYWASLLGGRLLLGVLGPRLSPRRALAGGSAIAIIGAAILWSGHSVRVVSVVGYVLLGVSLAGVYPSLVALTPERLGRRRAQRAMGVQAAAAGLGVALVPAAVGVVAERGGTDLLGPAVVVSALILASVVTLSAWVARRPAAPCSAG
ncbi:MAG: MFS transporter [Acidimicrobiales bacterium]|nr:MFS transporter [Acidimicrobiales bacterium]